MKKIETTVYDYDDMAALEEMTPKKVIEVLQYAYRGYINKYACPMPEDTLFTGHGMKSAVIAGSLLRLTEEELACIVYHMGAFTESSEWKNYTRAIKRYPNVLWTHQADMLATHVKGV